MKFLSIHRKFIGLFIVAFISMFGIYRGLIAPMLQTLSLSSRAYEVRSDLQEALNTNDWTKLGAVIDDASALWSDGERFLSQVSFLRIIPKYGFLISDAQTAVSLMDDVLLATKDLYVDLTPYQFVFGFAPNGTTSETDNTQKLETFLTASPQLIPPFRTYMDQLEPILEELNRFSWDKYSSLNVPALTSLSDWYLHNRDGITSQWEQARDILTVIPLALGEPDPQEYLILFQNDKELRPTGGFITSYALMDIDGGKITVGDSNNIYEVSDPGTLYTPPAPIVMYLKQSYWFLRDLNFSPDFAKSMETFTNQWNDVGMPRYNGVIAIDTEFVAEMLALVGPITVPGYDIDFSLYPSVPDACQVGGEAFTPENAVCRIEFYAEKMGSVDADRKEIIGILMREMFRRFMEIPTKELLAVVQKGIDLMGRKHLLLNFKEPQLQEFVESYNWAGRVSDPDGDYLYVNDANLAGLKSDMYIKRSVEQKITSAQNGRVTKEVKISYYNSGAFDGWLNATGRNYLRVYVPKGSELVSVSGGLAQTKTYDDLGKTVFDNFVTIPPLTTTEITFTYTLPVAIKDPLSSITIQKQPGVTSIDHKIIANGQAYDLNLVTDTVLELN